MYVCMYVCMYNAYIELFGSMFHQLTVVCFQVVNGEASSYELILTFHQYNNPTGGRVNQTNCCDYSPPLEFCFAPCETRFVLCLRSDHFPHADPSCPWQKVETRIAGGNSITFSQTIGITDNPIIFESDFFPEV